MEKNKVDLAVRMIERRMKGMEKKMKWIYREFQDFKTLYEITCEQHGIREKKSKIEQLEFFVS